MIGSGFMVVDDKGLCDGVIGSRVSRGSWIRMDEGL